MINIREYEETDAEPVMSLIRQLQAHEVALFDRMKPVADMAHWYIDLLKKQCAKDEGIILIAEEDDKALGYATILTNVIEDGSADEVDRRHRRRFVGQCGGHSARAGGTRGHGPGTRGRGA